MKLYNTLTRSIDVVNPQKPPEVKVYTCGPTVYDYSHIGHWYTYIRADLLIRALKAQGWQPDWVMNITDVGHLTSDADEGEDKLEKGARREGKTAWEVAEFYTKDFLDDLKKLNIQMPTKLTKATDYIQEQINMIQQLEAKGFTYQTDDGIYFDTSKFPSYADFARLDLKDQLAGARVSVNEQKKQPWDFALWKFSPSGKKRDMEWSSPWGTGFPGWHVECSAMSMACLGKTLDVHTGGIDHVPVHHTNEIAQSEAVTGQRFSNYWVHSEHVLVNDEKISKSLGNGIRLQDIIERGIRPEALRLNVLESHYRSQAKFSWQGLEAAQNRLQDLYAMAALQHQAVDGTKPVKLDQVETTIKDFLSNDLDTPSIVAYLSQLASKVNENLVSVSQQTEFSNLLKAIDELLGLRLSSVTPISEAQQAQIQQRETERKKQDWVAADKVRDALAATGIGLRDTDHGTIWYPLLTVSNQT